MSKLSNRVVALAVIVVAAVFVGVAVVRAPVLLALAAVIVAWLIAPTSVRLTLVLATVFLPFALGDIGPVPDLLVAEILVPVASLTGLIACVRTQRRLLPSESVLYVTASIIYAAISLGHAFVMPGGLSSLGGIGGSGTGLRALYDLLLGPAAFLAVMWLASASDLLKNGVSIMRALVWIAAAAAVLRVASYYGGFDMPLMGGTFRYGALSRVVTGGLADRIGGLAEAASLGIAGVFGLWFARDRGRWLLLPGATLSAAVVLSGGRTLALGVLVAGGLVSAALSARARSRAAILGVVVAVLGTAGVIVAGFTRQFDRLLAFTGGLSMQDPRRYAVIAYQLQEFVRSPVFGKGIGVSTVPLSDVFVAEQVSRGGHSTYSSVLANQGIVGFGALLVVAAGPVLRAFKEVRRLSRGTLVPSGLNAVLMFVLFYGVTKLTQFAAGGNGYADITPYAYAGLLVACLVGLSGGTE